MTDTQACNTLLEIAFGNVWFCRDLHAEAAETLVNLYRKLKSRVVVAEKTADAYQETITKLQSQLAKENARNQELENIIQKQNKATADAVNNESRVRELEEKLNNRKFDEAAFESLEKHCRNLETINKNLNHNFDSCYQDKEELRLKNEKLTEDFNHLEEQLNICEGNLDETEKELAEKTAQIEELQSIRDDLNWFKGEIKKFYDEVMKDGSA